MDKHVVFTRWKMQSLSKTDLSKKGSVDQDIEETVRFINLQDCYFTTSSCSGRIIMIDDNLETSAIQKQNCSWLFVTHQLCNTDEVFAALQKAVGETVLKFEPFVLHVQCCTLEDAQLLCIANLARRHVDFLQVRKPVQTDCNEHSVAVNSGFRNSGITVGKKGKIVMAVRSTHCMEVPLSHKGTCLVSKDYIDFLVQTANRKMEENKRRIARFHSCLQIALQKEDGVCEMASKEQTASTVYTRKRRKESRKLNCTSCEEEEAEPEADLMFFTDMPF